MGPQTFFRVRATQASVRRLNFFFVEIRKWAQHIRSEEAHAHEHPKTFCALLLPRDVRVQPLALHSPALPPAATVAVMPFRFQFPWLKNPTTIGGTSNLDTNRSPRFPNPFLPIQAHVTSFLSSLPQALPPPPPPGPASPSPPHPQPPPLCLSRPLR